MAEALAVAFGAAVGGLLRWLANLWLEGAWSAFPLATLVVNCVGGLLAGAALVLFARFPNEPMRLFAVTGVLGGFTTFSAFSAESLRLLTQGRAGTAALHTAAHVGGALLCAALGYAAAKAVLE